MRLVSLLLWVVATVLLMLSSRRSLGGGRGGLGRRRPDELVKDPVCHIYVVRSRAVALGSGVDLRYFCSDACARRWTAPLGR